MTAMGLGVRALLAAGLLVLGAGAGAALIWGMGFETPRDLWSMVRAGLKAAPRIEAHFNVFLEGDELTYRREPCDLADTEARFFLHIFPSDIADLPETRQGFLFDNLDFDFVRQGGSLVDGACTATVPLPKYPIAGIATGQFDETDELWSGSFGQPWQETPARLDNLVFEPGEIAVVRTHLYGLEVTTIGLEPFATTGGAIERVGNRLLVATPRGRFATISPDGQVAYLEGRVPMSQASPIADAPEAAPADSRVMDILARKRTDGRHDLFATHHFFNGRCDLFRLSVTTLDLDAGPTEALAAWRSIFDAKPCLAPRTANQSEGRLLSDDPRLRHRPIEVGSRRQGGGRLLSDGPRHLLVTVGSHGREVGEQGLPPPSQDPALHLGKVLRVNIATGAATILSLGHRNPQGFARDRRGNLWLTEHGPQGGDELNLIESGGNYGWPEVSYGYQYPSLKPEARPGHHEGFLMPIFAWVPSIGISAIAVNDETAFPLWQDDLLIASLWGRGHGYSLFRVRHRARQVKYVERINLNRKIRDLSFMGPDGGLALLLDSAKVLLVRRSDRWCDQEPPGRGHVYRVHCASAKASEPVPALQPPVAKTIPPLGAEAREGRRLYDQHCGGCHSLETQRYDLGPHLIGILGQRAGVAAMDSPALTALDRRWDEDSLRRFILDPASFAPGTSMPASGVSSAEAKAIVFYIAQRNAALATRSD